MKAVILAGGKGTRMGNISESIPKPMLTVGGIPILEHQIRLLKKYHINEIYILLNYLKDNIIDYFGNGENMGVKIEYFVENVPLGTVGGLKEIEDKLDSDFIVLYGDVMINMDLQRFINFHEKHNSQCSIVLHPNDHPHDSDLVEIDHNSRVTAFHSKPHNATVYYRNLVNAAVYIFNPLIFNFIEKGKKADFGKDIFPAVFEQLEMYGYNTAEYLKDMGTPQRFEEVNHDFETGKIARKSYEHKQKAIFLDRDGVLNHEISFIHRPEDLVLHDFTAEAVKKINQSEYLAIVITNQSVIARNLCTVKELEYIHNKMETQLGKTGAKLDAIFYCPHHPDKGFPDENSLYKIDCQCRKPQIGMLTQAAEQFNIDLSQSYIIGDTERDIWTGYNAGCKTVGVMTGYGLKKSNISPDYFFTDLLQAANFLIDNGFQPYLEAILQKITNTQSSKKPFVISIGGNACSGKSSLSTYLKMNLNQLGFSVLKIELDHWILPKNQRQDCKTVYYRYQMEKLASEISNILNSNTVALNTYPRHPNRESKKISYQYENQDVVIIEGVVALSHETLRQLSDYKVFVSIDMPVLKSRFELFNIWKGFDYQYIENLFAERVTDEFELIAKEIEFADLTLSSVY